MTILAFDTATSFGAVCALVPGGKRRATARAGDLPTLVDELVQDPDVLTGIVVGRGPGSFTSIRIGLAVARSLSFALQIPVAGVSTLDAFAGGDPVIDARRGEVFSNGPLVSTPDALAVDGRTLVGDGAIRYRSVFEANGAIVPPDWDPHHRPDPLLLAARAGALGDAGRVAPLYVREPDAKATA